MLLSLGLPQQTLQSLATLALATTGVVAVANAQSVVSPRFEDYSVRTIYRGPAKPPVIPDRTQLQGTDLRCFGADPSFYSKTQVNFAGHFVVDTCSCGSGCHYLFMWDAVTGKLYRQLPPGAIEVGPFESRDASPQLVYKGEEYRPNSTLLIVEGCIEDSCDCATRYYRWTGSRFHLVLQQPVRMPGRCAR